MPTDPPRRGSTLRFAAGVIAAAIVITALTLALITANLKAQIKARRERLRRAGIPMTLGELAPPPTPDSQNAAPLYRQAAGLLSPGRTIPVFHTVKSFVDRDPPGARAQFRAQVTAIVARNRPALDLLREGARRPHCRFPLDWNAPDPFALFGHEPWTIRDGAYQLLARAIIRMERGDTPGAAADLHACLRISPHLAEGAFVGSAWNSILVRDSALGVLQELIERKPLDVMTYRKLYEDLEEPDYQAVCRRMLLTDHIIAMWCFDTSQGDPARMRKELKPDTTRGRVVTACYLSPLAGLVRLREEVEYLDRFERGLALYEQPYPAAARGQQELEAELSHAPAYHEISKLWAPVDLGPGMPVRRDGLLVRQGAMQVALALQAYHSRYGDYPGSLESLRVYPGGAWAAPETRRSRIQSWKLPEDPFSGKPFGYRHEGKGFMLYSWGPDLKDDGGNPGQYTTGVQFSMPPPTGDVVWHYRR
jgi:hypothetical protein